MSSQEETATTAPAQMIQAINRDAVHKICSGQVVLSLAIAVKELVENAIDAGATLIEVKVREYGLESIEVSDNGSGVEESNFEGLTAKYHTSKLREFNDLETVSTFGFRGEALSSICALADMKIVTKHGSVDVATKLELNHRGEITKRTPCARQTGTTITLTNLFASLPVRRREFQRNIQKEFTKMCQILQGYGLISYGKRIILTNQTAKGGKITIMSTNGSYSIMDNIVAIFGAKQGVNLLKIRPPFEPNEVLTQDVIKSLDASINIPDDELDKLGLNRFEFEGYISSCSHGCGRGARDRQFFFINGRPCDPKTVAKVANEVYHRFNQSQQPFIVLNIQVERRDVDVNVTPDKRQAMVKNETILRLALKKSLLLTFGHIPSTFKVENQTIPNLFSAIQPVKKEVSQSDTADDDVSDTSSVSDDFEQKVCTEKGNPNKFATMLSQWKMTGKTDASCSQKASKRKNQPLDEILARNFKMQKIHEYLSQETVPQKTEQFPSYKSDSESESEPNENSAKVTSNANDNDDAAESDSIRQNALLSETIDTLPANTFNGIEPPDSDYRIVCKVKAIDTPKRTVTTETYTPQKQQSETPLSIHDTLKKCEAKNSHQTEEPADQSDEPNDVSFNEPIQNVDEPIAEDEAILCMDDDVSNTPTQMSQPKKITTISTSIEEIKSMMMLECELQATAEKTNRANRIKFKTKIDPKQNQSAEQELKTEINKRDFVRMELIGQFNLGFIIVRLDDDLFIIDQHATDEKYNFETLQKTTVLQHQRLVLPQDLDITAVNEMILMNNLKVFEANGFQFDIDMERPVTKRVKLIGKPFSKNWEFGKEDIDELIFMLQEGTSNASYLDTCRPSRVRAMFASRACRSSVMIGTALSKTDMRRLVDHMGTIEQPWNCPHGRPTIRHLLNLQMLSINDDQHNSNNSGEE